MNTPLSYTPNETTKLLVSLSTFIYLCGLPAIWDTHPALTRTFIKVYDKIVLVVNIFLIFFSGSAIGALFTQTNLSARQEYDRTFLAYVAPCLIGFYITLSYYKAEVRIILYHLAVVLKELYNDPQLEEEMTKKIRVGSKTFFILSWVTVVAGGLIGVYKVITAGEIFCPVIPAWPVLTDTSAVSVLMRSGLYVCWWLYHARAMATFVLIVTMLVVIYYQFKQLHIYFCGLDDIFHESLSQEEKEMKYIKAFKFGIHMHAVTLWCRRQHQDVCEWIFASAILMCIISLMVELTAIMNGKSETSTLMNTFPVILSTLVSLGFFMWNGGDITFEASKVSEAMYCSGWENCRGLSSARVRKLVSNAIRQAQEPVVYKTLGVVELSYDSFVQISKLPYTVVSMFY